MGNTISDSDHSNSDQEAAQQREDAAKQEANSEARRANFSHDEETVQGTKNTSKEVCTGADTVEEIGVDSMVEADAIMREENSVLSTEHCSDAPSALGEQENRVIDVMFVDPEDNERGEEENCERREDKRLRCMHPAFMVVLSLIISSAVSAAVFFSTPVHYPDAPPIPTPAPTELTLITIVIQLDNKPGETGWLLVCDGDSYENAPPGTYAFLTGRPNNFRIECQAAVIPGAVCQLTIMDLGGDGLNGGFYSIYNDNDSQFMTGGTIFSSGSTMNFTTPAVTTPPTPTATLTERSEHEKFLCTVCPDGTPVPFPDVVAHGWSALSCQDLNFVAATIHNHEECRDLQDDNAYECGCKNFCATMCPDRFSEPNLSNANDVALVRNNQQVTCADFQSHVKNAHSNSPHQCHSANVIGEGFCGCPAMGPHCSICPDGTDPSPQDLVQEIVPGVSCLDIAGFAYGLKPNTSDNSRNTLCTVYNSVGAYCGCDETPGAVESCRLCGSGNLLPDTARLVNSAVLGITTTCYHVEFQSNINDGSALPCDKYKDDVAEECCYQD